MITLDELNAAATIQDGVEEVIIANVVWSITLANGTVVSYEVVVNFSGSTPDENSRVYIDGVIYELTLDGSTVTAYRIITEAEGIPTLDQDDQPFPLSAREGTGGAYGVLAD